MNAYASFDKFQAAQRPKHRTIIRALRRFVKTTAPTLTEGSKWEHGCWFKGTSVVAYVYAGYPGYVQFGFTAGARLKDPKKLFDGDGKYIRHIKVFTTADIDRRAFAALLRQAVRR
jgi:hypothetical protein